MDALSKLENALEQIKDGLNSSGALNYTASFGIFEASGAGHMPLPVIVTKALGHRAVLGGTAPCSVADMVGEVLTSVRYAGDSGSHPCPDFLPSQALADLTTEVSHHLAHWAQSADVLASIWLKDGHPFYPVFWDFAFLAVHGPDATLLIGSSSD